MGRRMVYLAPELWLQICTLGSRTQVECTEGLPAGAHFVQAFYHRSRHALGLLFEHESWDDWGLAEVMDAPIQVAFKRIDCE